VINSVWVHSLELRRAREDHNKGHRQGCSVQTQLLNWVYVHKCVFVYSRTHTHPHTHTHRLFDTSVPTGLCGWGLNKSPAHSHSPESQHLSAHIISQIPDPSLNKDTFCILSLLPSSSLLFHPSIHPSIYPSIYPSISPSTWTSLSVPRVLK